ncbi:MAG: AlpA family phage regulatory protein [Brevundimonas sp.]|nr:AlpA family phage regulatory protein [Brevundimonas sp.]
MRKLSRLPQVLERVPLSRAQLYQMMSEGRFPKPIKLGENARAVAWDDAEIDLWIEARIADREAA